MNLDMPNKEPQQQEQLTDTRDENEDVYAYMVNGPRKLFENSLKTLDKNEANKLLKRCRYTTPAWAIAGLLSIILDNAKTQEDNWIYIASHYTPKTINSVIREMASSTRWGYKIKNPPAYFTSMFKHKKMRKQFRKKK